MKLTEHFTLAEMCKTSVNLKNVPNDKHNDCHKVPHSKPCGNRFLSAYDDFLAANDIGAGGQVVQVLRLGTDFLSAEQIDICGGIVGFDAFNTYGSGDGQCARLLRDCVVRGGAAVNQDVVRAGLCGRSAR